MIFRLILIVLFGLLVSCKTAGMSVDPQLNTGFDKYKISERPGLLSGDKMKFGPYLATGVDYDWAKGSSTTVGAFKDEKKSQRYRFNFKGKDNWKAECTTAGKGQSVDKSVFGLKVEFGMEEGLYCRFTPDAGRDKESSVFDLRFKGPEMVQARGQFDAGTAFIDVSTNNKIEGSSLGMGIPSGFHFHAGNKLVGAADNIQSEGPIWLSHALNPDEKDRVSIVMVALLLMQQKL